MKKLEAVTQPPFPVSCKYEDNYIIIIMYSVPFLLLYDQMQSLSCFHYLFCFLMGLLSKRTDMSENTSPIVRSPLGSQNVTVFVLCAQVIILHAQDNNLCTQENNCLVYLCTLDNYLMHIIFTCKSGELVTIVI